MPVRTPVMASNYNRRPLPAEVLVDEGRWRVIDGPGRSKTCCARGN